MDVKRIESLRWKNVGKTFNMSENELYLHIDNLISECSEKLQISFTDLKQIFQQKNEEFYNILDFYFDKNRNSKKDSYKKMLIYCSIQLPDTTDYVEEVYEMFLNLTDCEKVEFLKRIEPIKSKLEI